MENVLSKNWARLYKSLVFVKILWVGFLETYELMELIMGSDLS